ncbi:MAG: polysaccharide export protein [Verrucomicrobia bacterium]|nr:polysaccharide export protein [Verrucomicrobiota bacterium]
MKTLHRSLVLRQALGLLFVGFAVVFPVSAAEPPPSAPTEAPKAASYRIAPSDKVSISIIGESEYNAANKRVDANGNVNLALIGEVHIAGLTVVAAQTAIENAYKEGRIFRNPQVSLNIEDYSPREVSISGMVKIPAKYPLPPETVMTLKDLVLRAGGFTDTANGKKVRVSRPQPDGTSKIFTKDIDSVIRSKDTKNSTDGSFVLEPGDVVYVDEKMI